MTITVTRDPSTGNIIINMPPDMAAALDDYLDGIDTSDIALNPGYHGLGDDQAQNISYTLSTLSAALSKAGRF